MKNNATNYTQFAQDQLFINEMDEDNPLDESLLDFICSLDSNNIFAEKLIERICEIGYEGDKKDIKSIEKFVMSLIEDTPGINKDDFQKNIENWLVNTVPAGDDNGRKKIYMLCFALKMTVAETKEFFTKAYFEKPFNFRSVEETVYYYCLSKQLGYAEALRIINTIEERSIVDKQSDMVKTEQIRRDIEIISDEADLIDYCISNRCYFEGKNITAKEMVLDLVERCKKKAIKEHNSNVEAGDFTEESDDRKKKRKKSEVWKTISRRRLLQCIYGFDFRISKNKGSTIISGIKNFPSRISKNLPQEQQLQNILNSSGKVEASNDSIRKALILLLFYDYYTEEREDEGVDNFEDFLAEINMELKICGYQEFYLRNPYDWFFAFCAVQENPIDALRLLAEKITKE